MFGTEGDLFQAIAEDLIMTECEDLPVSIVRPSIVVSSWKVSADKPSNLSIIY